MNHRLFPIGVIVLVFTIFFVPSVFAQAALEPGATLSGSNGAARAHAAYTQFGGEESIKKRCQELTENNPWLYQDCIKSFKKGFCGIMNHGNRWARDLDKDINAEFVLCWERARRYVAPPLSRAGGGIAGIAKYGVPGPAIVGGAVAKTIQKAVEAIKAVDEIPEIGERMEEARGGVKPNETKKFDKTSMINSLNQQFLNQEISAQIKAATGLSLLKNERIELEIYRREYLQPYGYSDRTLAIVGLTIKDGKVVEIKEGYLQHETMDAFISEDTINAILSSKSMAQTRNIVLLALSDGRIRFSGTGAVSNIKLQFGQRGVIIYSKFKPSAFDVKRGQAKTVNFGGTEAKLEKNALGQRVVSVDNSNIVYAVSRGGERLGYSTKGTQNLLKNCSPTKRAYGQCSQTAGYYNPPSGYYGAAAGSGWLGQGFWR